MYFKCFTAPGGGKTSFSLIPKIRLRILGIISIGVLYSSKIFLYLCNMTRTEVKNEINKLIDKLPDSVLEELYELFKSAESVSPIDLKKNFNKILKEDRELLHRLAK